MWITVCQLITITSLIMSVMFLLIPKCYIYTDYIREKQRIRRKIKHCREEALVFLCNGISGISPFARYYLYFFINKVNWETGGTPPDKEKYNKLEKEIKSGEWDGYFQ